MLVEALFAGSRFLAKPMGDGHAVLTAVIGGVAWTFLAPIPLVGPVVALGLVGLDAVCVVGVPGAWWWFDRRP